MSDGPLPPWTGLDAAALARVVDDATNSYKHLFLRALLEEFAEDGFARRRFDLRRLAVGMLAAAWYPCRVHRLSLGAQDKVAGLLSASGPAVEGLPPMRDVRAALLAAAADVGDLARYVPYRLLVPYFAADLAGVPDHRRHAEIRALSEAKFASRGSLYRFVGRAGIELHPDWAAYLAANFAIVSGWAERRWIAYLQARNPFAPAVASKIGPPASRGSLAAQAAYWRRVMVETARAGDPMTCLYSGADLDPDRVDLDHFLPWSYVGHDAIWNLVPVLPAANAAKSDRIPEPGRYLEGFVARQHAALVLASRAKSAFRWDAVAADFADGLRLAPADLVDREALAAAYGATVEPQMAVAKALGFEGGWTYAR